ncbi:hypothetical protein [Streptomyces sp. NPDC052535]|uniref:hypothetical protein n=1 Tax=Streptomyces sp. NPDC052535 TaxID=3155531 RepID=UPI003449C78A
MREFELPSSAVVTDPRPSIVCPECGAQSWHPKDVEEGYCGRCHWWTGDPRLYAAWKAEREANSEEPPRAEAS